MADDFPPQESAQTWLKRLPPAVISPVTRSYASVGDAYLTIGYSAMFLAGILALVYVVRGLFTRSLTGASARSLSRMTYGVICFATLFSFVGTVLGGIWADQSWGRFWGWDPKENGAQLIVLVKAPFQTIGLADVDPPLWILDDIDPKHGGQKWLRSQTPARNSNREPGFRKLLRLTIERDFEKITFGADRAIETSNLRTSGTRG